MRFFFYASDMAIWTFDVLKSCQHVFMWSLQTLSRTHISYRIVLQVLYYRTNLFRRSHNVRSLQWFFQGTWAVSFASSLQGQNKVDLNVVPDWSSMSILTRNCPSRNKIERCIRHLKFVRQNHPPKTESLPLFHRIGDDRGARRTKSKRLQRPQLMPMYAIIPVPKKVLRSAIMLWSSDGERPQLEMFQPIA